MKIEDVDVSEYDEADRAYNEKFANMYRYMEHIKPQVLNEFVTGNDKKKIGELLTVYANLCATFGEFHAMTIVQTPNLSFKRKFYVESINKFNLLLGKYRKLVPSDKLQLTAEEKKLKI